MDLSDDSLKSATKLMQGKTHRSSGEKVQVKLSDKVMMEEIEKNPELMKIYQDHQIEQREHLPPQQEFVTYLRSQTTIKILADKTSLKKTTIEHWFRRDKAGFSHPSVEDWNTIKPFLGEVMYDKEMTTLTNKEWTMWPTPRALDPGSLPNKKGGKVLREEAKKSQPEAGGTLNPTWVEWLMGYPTGHTDLKR
jgi:DNA (cytosine-5)-methyltransferase 1|tara:strand:- start:271 stop:849 length:579 start_codon:yes stop_codon:yes gene_type:complete